MRILILEDEGLIALMLAIELESAGHHVVGPASNVATALRLAAAHKPDLALLDVNLGEPDCDGVDAAIVLLERYGIRSLFVSGNIDWQRAMQVRPWGLLRKPCDPRSLVETVEAIDDILNGRASERRLPNYIGLPATPSQQRGMHGRLQPQAASLAAGASS